MSLITVPFRLLGGQVIIKAEINGVHGELALDGSVSASSGPTFNGADFQRHSLPSYGMAYGFERPDFYRTEANIKMGGATFREVESMVDIGLDGVSTIGLGFFLGITREINFNFDDMVLSFSTDTAEEADAFMPAPGPRIPAEAAA